MPLSSIQTGPPRGAIRLSNIFCLGKRPMSKRRCLMLPRPKTRRIKPVSPALRSRMLRGAMDCCFGLDLLRSVPRGKIELESHFQFWLRQPQLSRRNFPLHVAVLCAKDNKYSYLGGMRSLKYPRSATWSEAWSGEGKRARVLASARECPSSRLLCPAPRECLRKTISSERGKGDTRSSTSAMRTWIGTRRQ